jgi:[protein-PII] uridylyltransferase
MTAVRILADSFLQDREALLERLRRSPDGLEWCRAHSQRVDQLLRSLFEQLAVPANRVLVALMAVGGYGRRELAPYSDVDLIVVPREDSSPELDDLVRSLHRELHNVFAAGAGTALSYSFFLVNDAPALDPKSRTAVLDARLVCGSADAFEAFVGAFRDSLSPGEFALEKIREREAAHARWNDTPLVVEPHLKEGAGGLRSFQCANWIRDAIGEPPASPGEAYEAIARARNLLHLTAGGNVDRFTRGRQAEVAQMEEADVFEYVSQIAGHGLELLAEYHRALDLTRRQRYVLVEGVQADEGAIRFLPAASLSAAALGVAVGTPLGLVAEPAEASFSTHVDGPAALFAIGTGEETLRAMDACGLLEKLLPELTRCRTLLPNDTLHVFTVFEHTLRTLRRLESFPAESFYGRLREGLSSVGPLYLAALLHDAGKAVPDRPHSETGAEIAAEVARHWGLAPGVASTVEWLVREHLTLARFIGMRDVSDPATSLEFARIVGDRERLDMLALLTCADAGAVSPEAWTPAQDAFLRELHARTSAVLESEEARSEDPAAYRRRLLRTLRDHPAPDREIEAFLERLPAQYAVSTAPEMVPLHMELVRKAEAGEASVVWDHDAQGRLSEVTVCARDAPGLLSRILGVLYAYDLSVHGVRASTTEPAAGAPAVALDTVLASFGHQAVPSATSALVVKALVQIVQKGESLDELLRRHGKDPHRRQEHFTFDYVEPAAPGAPGILEVQAPRGRGMAFRLARMIAERKWNIVAARFGQWAGRGAAAFYVLGPEGVPLSRAEALEGLRREP